LILLLPIGDDEATDTSGGCTVIENTEQNECKFVNFHQAKVTSIVQLIIPLAAKYRNQSFAEIFMDFQLPELLLVSRKLK